MRAEVFARLLSECAAKRSVAILTNLQSGEQSLLGPSDEMGGLALSATLREAALRAIEQDSSRTIETEEGPVFIHVHSPPLRLAVVGAVHIAQPLVAMATVAGYAVTLIDPRQAFASDERFPGVAIMREWPGEALARLEPDHRTAIVTLGHDPKLDDPALDAALRSDAFYIGALGSERTQAARRERLREAGFTDADFKRIHGPVGLAIGARSPAEIAVSIIAEMTQARRQPGALAGRAGAGAR